MPNLQQVQKTDTFEIWRQKTNLTIDDLNNVWGGGIIRLRTNGLDVDYDNNEDNSAFNVTIDGISNIVLSITPLGDLTVARDITATRNITAVRAFANLTGDVTGDVYASNGTTKILENGNGTTIPAAFTGNLTGNVNGIVTALAGSSFIGPLTGDVTGNVTGNVTGKFVNARSISITGDATWTTTFDGSANVTGVLTLANSGVTAGTYTKLTVDSKGRVTSGTALSSADVTSALTYTPLPNNGKAVDSALLNGYTQTSAATANTVMWRDASGNTSINNLYGTAQFAKYADLAEKYKTLEDYPVGTVIVVATDLVEAECMQSMAVGQPAIGVISEKPAYLMNYEAEGQAVALKGRVPVRVIGPIAKGQQIMSTINGQACAGSLNSIGIALETNLNLEEKLVECIIL